MWHTGENKKARKRKEWDEGVVGRKQEREPMEVW